jgi:hypothetical protein
MKRTMTKTIAGLIAGTALVVGLAACGTPTEAAKVASAPSASVSVENDEPDMPTEAEEPTAEIKTSFKVGDTAKVGDWEVTVTKVTRPTRKQVVSWNEFNEKPEGVFVRAEFTAKYTGTERTKDVGELSWKFGGSDAQVYENYPIVTPTNGPTEARTGGKIKQDVVFDVPKAAVRGGVVTVEGYDETMNEQFADFAF